MRRIVKGSLLLTQGYLVLRDKFTYVKGSCLRKPEFIVKSTNKFTYIL